MPKFSNQSLKILEHFQLAILEIKSQRISKFLVSV